MSGNLCEVFSTVTAGLAAAATGLIAIGIGVLIASPWPLLAVFLYGGGVGIAWIARGTVPLALFGQRHYAILMGRLVVPSLLAQALSPFIGTFLLTTYGPLAMLTVLLSMAVVAFITALWLKRRTENPWQVQ